jgi:phospholipid/cholesterol/gamma-HCH transport system permease protein
MEKISIQNSVINLVGEINSRSIPLLIEQIATVIEKEKPLTIDLSGVVSIDSAGVAFIESLQDKILTYSKVFFLQNIPEHLKPILKTFSSVNVPAADIPVHVGIFEALGGKLLDSLAAFKAALVVAADVFFWSFYGLFNRKGQRKGAFTQQGVLLGVEALPVVGLLSLIIGFILSLQSAAQLRNFGANVFIADLLAISLVREMGPMMTAIIVAGRRLSIPSAMSSYPSFTLSPL